jgi:outer membrane scaffolding protein for murein synthesis (MipA/OmpV family)
MLQSHGAELSFLRPLRLASLLTVSVSAAAAADLAPAPAPAPSPLIVTLGLGPQVIPSFPGARTYRVWPIGTLAWRRQGDPEIFTAPDDGFGLALLDIGWLRAGPVGRVLPRRGLSNGNGNFYGLHNVGWTLEIGGFTEVWLAPFLRTRVEVRQGINGHNGLDANVGIDGIAKFGAWTLSAGPRLALGNSTFMNAYFSVTPAEALANGRVGPYQASGGVTSFGGLVSAKYDFMPNLSATLYGGYERLVNSAAASPIPNRLGSLNQWTGGVVFAYSFQVPGL